MKARVVAVILIVLIGMSVGISVFVDRAETAETYADSIIAARENAKKGIPYNAVNYYEEAFKVSVADEGIYQEYLEQCKLLGEDFYYDALTKYRSLFPESPQSYEELCRYFYENKEYRRFYPVAIEAKNSNLATDAVRDMFMDCRYEYKYIKTAVEEASPYLGKYSKVKRKDQYGFIDENGYFLLYPEYDQAGFFAVGSTAVFKEGEWYVINEEGYKIAVCDKKPDYLSFMSNGHAPVAINGKYGYVDSSYEIPDKLEYDFASNFSSNVAAVKKADKWALINNQLENITDFIFDDIVINDYNSCISNNIIIAKKDGKYWLVDASGNRISENGYDEISPFVTDEYAAVKVGDKWGFINTSGEMVIQPQYEAAKSFCINLAPVCIDGRWGYINNDGQEAIACQFDECMPFNSNGVTAVKEGEYWNYIKLLIYCN